MWLEFQQYPLSPPECEFVFQFPYLDCAAGAFRRADQVRWCDGAPADQLFGWQHGDGLENFRRCLGVEVLPDVDR